MTLNSEMNRNCYQVLEFASSQDFDAEFKRKVFSNTKTFMRNNLIFSIDTSTEVIKSVPLEKCDLYMETNE